MRIPIEMFGKDHWSTFAYICCRIAGHEGVPEKAHMRTDLDLHPALGDGHLNETKYPTRLAGGVDMPDHDDWDCAEDLEAAGLILQHGTGSNPVFALTDKGWKRFRHLTEFKNSGGSFGEYRTSSSSRRRLSKAARATS
jgi:hypothetical protein